MAGPLGNTSSPSAHPSSSRPGPRVHGTQPGRAFKRVQVLCLAQDHRPQGTQACPPGQEARSLLRGWPTAESAPETGPLHCERRHKRSKTATGKGSGLRHRGSASCSSRAATDHRALPRSRAGRTATGPWCSSPLPLSLDAPVPDGLPTPCLVFHTSKYIPGAQAPTPHTACPCCVPLRVPAQKEIPAQLPRDPVSSCLFSQNRIKESFHIQPGTLASCAAGGTEEKAGRRPWQGQVRCERGAVRGAAEAGAPSQDLGPKATVSRMGEGPKL